MQHQLSFSSLLNINQDQAGLLVPITLSTTDRDIKIEAFLDTGAKYSVLPRWVGEELGLDIEAGIQTDLMTGAGPMPTYLHYLTLTVGDLAFDDAPICVSKFPEFSRCLLGRGGWIQSVRLGLVAYDDHPFLSLYNE
jgi:hypothetical protein